MMNASIPQPRIDWLAYDAWHAEGGTDKDFAVSIGMDANNFAQYKRRRHRQQPTLVDVPLEIVKLTPPVTSADDTALNSAEDSAELPAVQSRAALPTVQTSTPNSAETLQDHETRLQMLEGFMAALQAQARQAPVQHITVQSRADSTYALHSAEPVQSWDNPEDAKPERWNLWLPRGLKRRIEAQARAAGIAPSTLVQRLLMASINGQEVSGHA